MTEPAMSMGTPACEIEISNSVVRKLLREQHPDLQGLPLRRVDAGWDNAMFRLGDELAVRLPRRQVAAGLIEHEQVWLPLLAPRLTLPVPVPVRMGMPSDFYPWQWSVVPWIDGVSANRVSLGARAVEPFVDFVRSLHTPVPANAPHNPFRSVPLSARAGSVEARLERLSLKTGLITPCIRRIWESAVQAPDASRTTWIHGDLHPRNILVNDGEISGVIDWGDATAGDVSTDLAAIWMLFESRQDQKRAIAHYGMSAMQQRKAKGWAIFFAAVLLETGLVNNPENAQIGISTFQRLAQDSA